MPLSPALEERLAAFRDAHPKVRHKGGLCVALVVTRAAQSGLPLDPKSLVTAEGGQVRGLGRAAVQAILAEHGIAKVLAEEGGRTSRGSLGLMGDCVALLNALHAEGPVDAAAIEAWWIDRVREHFAAEGPRLNFDGAKSLHAILGDLLAQARRLQEDASGANFLGAMLQHLVGARLSIALPPETIAHHGFAVADAASGRSADFQIDRVCLHVTTSPGEALVAKCGRNLAQGLRPMILTTGDSIAGAAMLLRSAGVQERVDVIEVVQFLADGIRERSGFAAGRQQAATEELLARYNAIVSRVETDPALRVRLGNET